jgi:hypothetical protein
MRACRPIKQKVSGCAVSYPSAVIDRPTVLLSMHYTSRIVLFVNTRTDSVSKTSNFHRMSNDLTLQQGLELLLNPR